MEYKAIRYENKDKKKVVLIPGWNSSLPLLLINKLKVKYDLLILLFPVAHYKENRVLNMNDYIDIYNKALKDLNFVPDIRIGHSFGGKILSFIIDEHANTFLIAPSCFVPLLRERILVKYKILRNKMFKRVLLVFNKKTPSKYLGSLDYQRCNELERKTFINIKDAYPSTKTLLKHYNLNILAYTKDKEVPLKRIKKRFKNINNSSLFILKGNHYTIFEVNNPLLYLLEKRG